MTGERILIIDDDPECTDFLLTDVLLPNGYLVRAAANGRAGFSAVLEEQPDLVLLDLNLQDVAYTEMLEQLKGFGDPPVILLTPPAAEAEALQAIRLGARDALVQPFTAEKTAALIARVLHQERLDRERDSLVRRLTLSNETLKQSLTEAQTLYDADKATTSSLRLEDVLTAVVYAAIKLTQAEEGYLLLRDSKSDELYLRASQNLGDAHATGLYVRVEDGIARHVIHSGEPVALSSNGDAGIEIRCKQTPDDASHLVRSLVNVPLYNQEYVIGVLGVANVLSDRNFAESDTILLSALADLGAVVISNAQNYARTDQALGCVLAELSATQYKTDLILQNISDGVFTVNRELRITSANAAMERITGWRESELLERRYEEVFAPQTAGRGLSPEQTAPGMALHTQSPLPSTQTTILRKDDRRISVISMAAPLRTSDTSVTGVLAIMRDIRPETGMNHVDCEILDTRRSRSLQFNPVAEAALYSLHPEAGSASPHCHPVTLRPIINQVVKHFQGVASGSSFQVALAPDLPFAIGNERTIELALVNLIDNALVLSHPEHPIRIAADADEDSVVVAVEGAGLDENHRQRIQHSPPMDSKNGNYFAPWTTPQASLYITSKLIQAQGGQVWTESRSGTSICFNFSLPRIEEQDVAEALID